MRPMHGTLKRFGRGFTLVELLVVLSIVSVLLAVVLFGVGKAHENSRDKERAADVGQIALAIRQWQEETGKFTIDCPTGMVIGENASNGDFDMNSDTTNSPTSFKCPDGPSISSYLDTYFHGQVPHDPLGPGNRDYYYYFDATHNCNKDQAGNYLTVPMVYAVNLETMQSNAVSVCQVQSGGDGGFNDTLYTKWAVADGATGAYKSTLNGVHGTKNPSTPFVVTLNQK